MLNKKEMQRLCELSENFEYSETKVVSFLRGYEHDLDFCEAITYGKHYSYSYFPNRVSRMFYPDSDFVYFRLLEEAIISLNATKEVEIISNTDCITLRYFKGSSTFIEVFKHNNDIDSVIYAKERLLQLLFEKEELK